MLDSYEEYPKTETIPEETQLDFPDWTPNWIQSTVTTINDHLESIANRGPGWKRKAAALIAAEAVSFGLFGVATVSKFSSSKNDHSVEVAHAQKAKLTEKPHHILTAGATAVLVPQESVTLEVPSPSSLPPVMSTPIKPEKSFIDTEYLNGAIKSEIDQNPTKFIGSYQSTEGVGFNIYATASKSEKTLLDQNFTIHPQTLEFMLREIGTLIHDAPDVPTKNAIIENLRKLKQGKEERTIDLVIDVDSSPDCLDAELQIKTYLKDVCDKLKHSEGGVTVNSDISSNDSGVIPIIVSSGVQSVPSTLQGEAKEKFMKNFHLTGNPTIHTSKLVASPGLEAEYTNHELVHALSDPGLSNNTYRQGDSDHEITSWLLGEAGKYHFFGEKGASPKLADKIHHLTTTGALPAILSITK